MTLYTCLDNRLLPMWLVGSVEVTWWGSSWWSVRDLARMVRRDVNGLDNALRLAVEMAEAL